MDARASSVDANALDSLVRAAEEFTTQSVTHKFRAHRRFAVVAVRRRWRWRSFKRRNSR